MYIYIYVYIYIYIYEEIPAHVERGWEMGKELLRWKKKKCGGEIV